MRRDKAEFSCDAKGCKETYDLPFRADAEAWPKGWTAYEIKPMGQPRASVVYLCAKHKDIFLDLTYGAVPLGLP